jgi:lipid-binding SYLF domain-containing protein
LTRVFSGPDAALEAIMHKPISILMASILILLASDGRQASARADVAGTLFSASEVLEALHGAPPKCIPQAILNNAQGVAIIPKLVRAGLGIGGRYGEGVVLVRNADGTWCDPIFVTITGGSVGWQIGIESVDLVLVFRGRKSLDRILEGKGKLTLGADVSVAAGPVGRQAEGGTDALLRAEICSYSRSKGLFAGIALDGAVMLNHKDANRAFRERPLQEDVMAAAKLKNQLTRMCNPPAILVPPPGAVIGR